MDNEPNTQTGTPPDRSPDLTPVVLRARHDGWTPERQVQFIEALAESGCVEAACKKVGMSKASAYRLRRRPCGDAFRDAWDAALDYALCQLEEAALARAIHGVPRPIFYKGEQIGEWREHDERLTMFLLRFRRRARFGPWLDREEPPIDRDAMVESDESGPLLDFHLRQVAEFAAEWPDDGVDGPSEAARG